MLPTPERMPGTATTRGPALPILKAEAERAIRGEARAFAGASGARISVFTLGCDKNTVDSERILARLHRGGGQIAELDDADVVVINTCGFIDIAKEESIDAILDAVRLKQGGRIRAVVAMGCLVQRYKDELQRELPEVDLFLGLTEAERLVPELAARGLLPGARNVSTMEQPLLRLSTSTRHTSYLKISEGCDHTCAFCAIPLMRGKHRSTPIDLLVREAAELEAAGVVELNLVSQDTTWYGRDHLQAGVPGDREYFVGRVFAGMAGLPAHAQAQASANGNSGERRGRLIELLRGLLDGTSVPWFRLFYAYPSGIRPDLVELIAREPRIVPYLDMPIQHGADRVLERMRRPERKRTIRERVAWLRAAVPDLTLRTTVIVGFPGETEDDFEELLALLEEIRFDRLGAFSYSEEENTRAAAMDGQVPEPVRRERLERLLDVQRAITMERNEAWVGREVSVLVDEVVGRDSGDDAAPGARGAVGRTEGQALEVDGVVHIADGKGARAGEFVRARITDALEHDLIGERVIR